MTTARSKKNFLRQTNNNACVIIAVDKATAPLPSNKIWVLCLIYSFGAVYVMKMKTKKQKMKVTHDRKCWEIMI